MATQFTVYKSTDTSAPTLSGTVGDLVNLMDKCLVTGYGSKAAAGWAATYSGTNKSALTQGTGSVGMLYRIQDDAPGATPGAREARVTGYESMTTVDAGTNPFPTAALGVGGVAMVVARKSTAASATTRAWKVFADARTAYVFMASGDFASFYCALAIGEFYSFVSSDAYRNMIIGQIAEGTPSIVASGDKFGSIIRSSINNTGHFLCRGHTGTGGACGFGKHAHVLGVTGFSGAIPYTNPADGSLILTPVHIHDNTTAPAMGVRGRLRGIYQAPHPVGSFADGDTVTGVGDLSGKTFEVIKGVFDTDSNLHGGNVFIETSATVEAN